MSDAGLNGTNVLLVGKTGVGKSSLLNYLYAREVAAWGSGKPVTPEGIHKLPSFFYNDLKVNPYDTAGMESGSAGKWFKELEAALLENGEQDIRDWFHTIIYCVDAQKSRLDDFEIKVIRSFLESGNRLILALTKCDIATSSQCEGLSAALSEEFPGLPQVRTAAGNQGGFAPPAPLRLSPDCPTRPS